MDITAALQTAITYEKKVRDLYSGATKKLRDPKGKRVFQVLTREEQGHVIYLETRLREWEKTGILALTPLETAIPTKRKIEQEASKLKAHMADIDPTNELQMLSKALEVEKETSAFYQRMAKELPAEGQKLFKRFVEIEEGHVAIVEAEMDYLVHTGYWFDFLEIDLDGA